MKNRKIWRPRSKTREDMTWAILEDEARIHALAVEAAREFSGFEDERAIHAFAVTIGRRVEDMMSSPSMAFFYVEDEEAAGRALGRLGEIADDRRVDILDAFLYFGSIYTHVPYESLFLIVDREILSETMNFEALALWAAGIHKGSAKDITEAHWRRATGLEQSGPPSMEGLKSLLPLPDLDLSENEGEDE